MKFLRCEPKEKSGKKIAIIGGGVSGLSAAGDLICKHEVHVFDEMQEMGGFLRYGISSYFFPREGLEDGIKELERAGVMFNRNQKVDDYLFEKLVSEYDAVLIATGSWEAEKVELEGMEKEGVYYAIDLIKSYNAGLEADLKGKLGVVITEVSGRRGIGGDLLLVDLILLVMEKAGGEGVEKVTVTYKGSRNESKFAESNLDYVENYYFEFTPEKFEFMEFTETLRVLGDGQVSGIEVVKTKRENGKIVRTGETLKIDVDAVIIASPPRPTPPFKENHGIELNPDGTIKTDGAFKTTREKVFACGNVKHGPWFLIPAYRSGKTAAKFIDEYLKK